MSEHQNEHERVEDLDVPESDAADVKGGSINFAYKENAGVKAGLKLDGIGTQKVSWG